MLCKYSNVYIYGVFVCVCVCVNNPLQYSCLENPMDREA